MGSFTSSIAKNFGAIEKCIIVFTDNRKALEEETQKEGAAGGAGSKFKAKSVNASMKASLGKSLLGGGGIADYLSKSANLGQSGRREFGENERAFRVQFNPASLTITGDAPDPTLAAQYDRPEVKEEKPKDTDVKVVYSISFQLIFDDCDLNDAFLENKLLGSYSNPISMGAGMVSKLKGDNAHSVRPQMEAFIAAARGEQDALNTVTLYWGSMSYRGYMNSLDCKYTMFNPAGEPIRGTVDISLMMNHDSSTSTSYNRLILSDSYDNVFGTKAKAEGSGFDKFKKKSSNLLNFG